MGFAAGTGLDAQEHASLETRLVAIERCGHRPEGAMPGDDEPIHNAGPPPRSRFERFPSTDRIHVCDARADELLELSQRHCLRDTVVMPKGMKGLGDHQVGHDDFLTGDHRAFDSPTRDLHLSARLAD